MSGMDIGSSLSYALSQTKNFFHLGNYPLTMVQSTVDNKYYRVRDMPDKQAAADLMARVRNRMNRLKMHVESAFPDKNVYPANFWGTKPPQ